MNFQLKIITVYIVMINLMAYVLMCYDKYQSKKKGQRISENSLLFAAFILGALGIYLGMKAPMYHKANKAKFKIVIPLLMILNSFMVYFIFTRLH
jgi:uncharacterized membrane protein YsdA (DUF1294 family)